MNLQHNRRRDPYPWTWEIPATVTVLVLLMMVMAIHVGRTGANLAAGGGFQFTHRSELFTSVWAILTGDATAGLDTVPTHLASGRSLTISILLAHVILLPPLVWGIAHTIGRWGPGRMLGMATPGEAEELLGLTRLRRNAAIIRPDLYPKRGRR